MFVQTNAPDTGHSNENFRLQVRSTFRTAGILCEKGGSEVIQKHKAILA